MSDVIVANGATETLALCYTLRERFGVPEGIRTFTTNLTKIETSEKDPSNLDRIREFAAGFLAGYRAARS